ncbi:MAG: DUF935 family protein [Synergistaceae bacterium]|nr:DUF935 family protein [Synergistaceae bacterium]
MATLKAKGADKSVGYGWSRILTQILMALDRPITNSDEFRSYYRQMLADDETIGTGLEYLTGHIVSKIGAYSHKDKKIKELVDRSIETIKGTMTEVRRSILRDSFAYGFGVGEFTVKSENGSWLLSSIQMFDPLNIEFKMTQFKDNSYGIGTVIQKAGTTEVEIPAEKCIIKTYGDNSTPYGSSLLRRCYRWWSFKKELPKLWAIALERFGMPLLHGKVSNKDIFDDIADALENTDSRSYIVTDKDTEITTLFTSSAGVSAGYIQAEELCDKMMYRAMFLPSLMGAGENGGSYSLGQVHFEVFNATVKALAEDYVDAELEQLWRPLIEWNFGKQDDYGTFLIDDDISTAEKMALSGIMNNLANIGALDPETDRAWIREVIGLPEIEEGAVMPRWQLEPQEPQEEEQPQLEGI